MPPPAMAAAILTPSAETAMACQAPAGALAGNQVTLPKPRKLPRIVWPLFCATRQPPAPPPETRTMSPGALGRAGSVSVDRKSTRLNSSHVSNSYAVFCLKEKTRQAGGDGGGEIEAHRDGEEPLAPEA